MSSSDSPTPGGSSEALQAQVFPLDEKLNTFVVLDGASVPDLLDRLYTDPAPDFLCLYRGPLEPDIAEVAPYLVQLWPDSPFTQWFFEEGWGKHWGVLAQTEAYLGVLWKHLRTFLMVRQPDGNHVYFRYYDPRVLRVYLPTCTVEETAFVFGPVERYLCEDSDPKQLLAFRHEDGLLRKQVTRIHA